MIFAEILDIVDNLELSDKEMLIDIINKRIIEQKRKIVLNDIRQGRIAYSKKNVQRGTSKDLLEVLNKWFN